MKTFILLASYGEGNDAGVMTWVINEPGLDFSFAFARADTILSSFTETHPDARFLSLQCIS